MAKISPLSVFSKTRLTLEKRGISFESQDKRYIPSSRILDDISSQSCKLEICENGIFYTSQDGLRARGYLCLLGNGDSSYPKAHICDCSTLHKYKKTEKTDRFIWANKRKIFIKVSGEVRQVEGLDICWDCLLALKAHRKPDFPTNTNEFVDRLEKDSDDELFPSDQGLGMFGRSQDWYVVRRKFLEKMGYTCENCGRCFKPINLRPFIDAVPAMEQTDQGQNRNLRCLCTGCQHSLYPERFKNPFQTSLYDMFIDMFDPSQKKIAILKIISSLNKIPILMTSIGKDKWART